MSRIFRNFHIKILALITSLLMWTFVVGLQNRVIVLNEEFDVNILNLETNLSIANQLDKVRIKVKTDSDYLASINKGSFEVSVDAKEFRAGKNNGVVKVESKDSKVNVVEIIPPIINVDIENISTKSVPVEYVVEGSPAFGFAVGEVKLNPSNVEVKGSEANLEKIKKLKARVVLNGFESADVTRNASVEIDSSLGVLPEQVTIVNKTVSANVKILSKPVTVENQDVKPKDIIVKPNEELISGSQRVRLDFKDNSGILNKYDFTPREVEIKYTYPNGTKDGKINARLDLNKIKSSGNYEISESDFDLPTGFVIESVSPKNVIIKFYP